MKRASILNPPKRETVRASQVTPPADVLRRAIQQELSFNPPRISTIELGKLPEMKQWFRIDEVALIFAVSESQIRNWIDEGVLEARAISSRFDPANPPKKICKRITRESVVRLQNDQTRIV